MADSIIITTNTPSTIVSKDIASSTVITSAIQGPSGAGLQEGTFSSGRFVITSLGIQTLDSFPYTSFGAAKYIVYATSGLKRQICELLLIQDGTNVQLVEYANMVTSSLLSNFSASIVQGVINIIIDPTEVGASFKFIRTLIKD
jgi:hypothetical protein